QRGVGYEAVGRMAKDPKYPPYVTLSKIDKSVAVKRIAELKKLEAEDALVIGDSMYAPKSRENTGRIGRAAVARADALAGPLALTGNEIDRKMESALPGAL